MNRSKTHLQGVTGAREKMAVVVTMNGNVQDARVVVEDLLRSITVMDVLKIKIHRQH